MRHTLFIGTYTENKSEGLYSCEVDEHFVPTGEMRLAARLTSPTYALYSAKRNILYAVTEPDIGGRGQLYAWKVEADGLHLIGKREAAGGGLVHLCFDKEEELLFAVSYIDASIQVYEIADDGSIGEMTDEKLHSGHGVNMERQSAPHAHSVWLSPDKTHIFVCDLGIDKVVSYRIDEVAKRLELDEKLTLKITDGAGPRHMVFHPNQANAYVLSEMSSEVFALESGEDGHFEIIQKLSALSDVGADSEGAAIRISSDGKYLYTSNRGEDNIAVFSVGPDGRLKKLANTPCGKHPRDFILSRDEEYLLTAERDSNTITVYERDRSSGLLNRSHTIQGVDMPVCLVEIG